MLTALELAYEEIENERSDERGRRRLRNGASRARSPFQRQATSEGQNRVGALRRMIVEHKISTPFINLSSGPGAGRCVY